RSSTPMLLLGIGVVAAIVLALALSRSGDDAAVEPIGEPTTSTTTTTAPTTSAQAPPPTTAPLTTLGAGAVVDVSDVPAELTELTMLLIERDQFALLDLATGELEFIAAPPIRLQPSEVAAGTELGIRIVNDQTGQIRFVDWQLAELTALRDRFPGAVVVAEGRPWLERWDPSTGELRLAMLDDDNELVTVIEIGVWFTMVGTTGDSVLISSAITGQTHRIDPNGSVTTVLDRVALGGGNDWLLAPRCDESLTCSTDLIDLRSGTTTDLGIDLSRSQTIGRSQDGRRALRLWGSGPEPEAYVVDADAATVAPGFQVLDESWGALPLATDPALTHQIDHSNSVITFRELSTGDEVALRLPQPFQHAVLVPEGWTPPS
ncbi:MAG: hypothetical protein AAGA99_16515, partial [Actinomycetota bacterium]